MREIEKEKDRVGLQRHIHTEPEEPSSMITKYFTKVCVKFNPFGPEARCARSVLSQIPPSMKGVCKIDLQLLNDKSTVEPFVQVTFKDNTVMSGNPAELKLADFTNMLDKHSKKLLFKEEVDK